MRDSSATFSRSTTQGTTFSIGLHAACPWKRHAGMHADVLRSPMRRSAKFEKAMRPTESALR